MPGKWLDIDPGFRLFVEVTIRFGIHYVGSKVQAERWKRPKEEAPLLRYMSIYSNIHYLLMMTVQVQSCVIRS